MRVFEDIYKEAEVNGLYSIGIRNEEFLFYVSEEVYNNVDVDKRGYGELFGEEVLLNCLSKYDDDIYDIVYGYSPGDYYTPDDEYEIERTINEEKVDEWEYRSYGGEDFEFNENSVSETMDEVKEMINKYKAKIAEWTRLRTMYTTDSVGAN